MGLPGCQRAGGRGAVLGRPPAWVPTLIGGYAIGALPGAAFLEVHLTPSGPPKTEHCRHELVWRASLIFFVLRLVLASCAAGLPRAWARSCSPRSGPAGMPNPGDDHGRNGLLILVGDACNFV